MSNNKLIPEIRFPEFKNEGGWDEKRISELGDTINGLTGKSGDDFGNGRPYVTYKQVFDNSIIDFEKCGKVQISSNENQNTLRKGDILFTTSSETPNEVGFASVLVNEPKEPTYLNSFCFSLRPFKIEEIKPEFSRYLFHSPAYRKSVTTIAQGSTRYNISKGAFLNLRVFVPNPKEQQKIASCLSSLDEVIAAHSQKLELLKDHKKGLMQNLFPQEGENVPKYRFKEFENDGEWVEKKLGEMTVKVGSGVTPLGGETNYKKTGRPFVRSQNVSWGVFLLENIALIDESTHQNSINTEIQVEDVLLNITGASIGRSAVANEFVSGGNVNQHVCIIRTEMEILNPFFLNQFLISDFGQKQIDSFQAGGNRQGLNFVQIRSLSIPVPPTIQEQQKIASCLSSLDALITSQVEKIEQLKLHKKGLMQKLFPSMSETGFEGLNDEQDV
jgi:type I restriction enzyme, S subunit